MKRIRTVLLAFLLIGVGVSGVSGASIGLFEWGLNVDNTVYGDGDILPNSINTSLFDFTTGLGTITFSTSTSGRFTSFFDHEIDEPDNTFFNELGSNVGTPGAGQSWEIDEPGFTFGNIYTNFTSGSLDNSVGTPDPDDVSMAMGWNFALAQDETASITLRLSGTAPTSGFYLEHRDPDSDASIYFSGDIRITGGPEPIPEPGTLMLLGSGLLGLIGLGRKKFMR